MFMDGETPESTWGNQDFDSKVAEENSETLDIFEPAMHNLFDCGSIITDKMLDGQFL